MTYSLRAPYRIKTLRSQMIHICLDDERERERGFLLSYSCFAMRGWAHLMLMIPYELVQFAINLLYLSFFCLRIYSSFFARPPPNWYSECTAFLLYYGAWEDILKIIFYVKCMRKIVVNGFLWQSIILKTIKSIYFIILWWGIRMKCLSFR